jgi:hypothetical protein
MSAPEAMALEEQIERWRNYLRRRQSIHSVDVAELEDHLREQVAALIDTGLTTDEAFLVAVKRMGDLDSLSREFAREHSERSTPAGAVLVAAWLVEAKQSVIENMAPVLTRLFPPLFGHS